MPLHTDDPDHPDNLTDEQYSARTQALRDKTGNKGLHCLPPEVESAVYEGAARRETK